MASSEQTSKSANDTQDKEGQIKQAFEDGAEISTLSCEADGNTISDGVHRDQEAISNGEISEKAVEEDAEISCPSCEADCKTTSDGDPREGQEARSNGEISEKLSGDTVDMLQEEIDKIVIPHSSVMMESDRSEQQSSEPQINDSKDNNDWQFPVEFVRLPMETYNVVAAVSRAMTRRGITLQLKHKLKTLIVEKHQLEVDGDTVVEFAPKCDVIDAGDPVCYQLGQNKGFGDIESKVIFRISKRTGDSSQECFLCVNIEWPASSKRPEYKAGFVEDIQNTRSELMRKTKLGQSKIKADVNLESSSPESYIVSVKLTC